MIILHAFANMFPGGVGETKDLCIQWALEVCKQEHPAVLSSRPEPGEGRGRAGTSARLSQCTIFKTRVAKPLSRIAAVRLLE